MRHYYFYFASIGIAALAVAALIGGMASGRLEVGLIIALALVVGAAWRGREK